MLARVRRIRPEQIELEAQRGIAVPELCRHLLLGRCEMMPGRRSRTGFQRPTASEPIDLHCPSGLHDPQPRQARRLQVIGDCEDTRRERVFGPGPQPVQGQAPVSPSTHILRNQTLRRLPDAIAREAKAATAGQDEPLVG